MKGCAINVLHKNGFSNTNHQLPKNKSSTIASQRENKPKIKCWLCSDEHHVMDCDKFRLKSVDERKVIIKKESLCWNCMSKSHVSKDCVSKYSYPMVKSTIL